MAKDMTDIASSRTTPADGIVEFLKQVFVRAHSGARLGRFRSWMWLAIMVWSSILRGRAFVDFSSVQAGSINAVKDFNKRAFWQGRRKMIQIILKIAVFSAIQDFSAESFKNMWIRVSTESLLGVYFGKDDIYYRAKLMGTLPNPEHRLTNDVRSIVQDGTEMLKKLPEHITTVMGMTGVMWRTSRYACAILWSYVLLVTLTSRLYFEQRASRQELAVQAAAAHVRYALQRAHECAEGIAFYSAADFEERRLVGMVRSLAKKEGALLAMISIFGSVELMFNRVASILPSLIMAPRFWRGLNKFADYSQMVSGFRKVQDALFFLADNYDKLASISARVERVEELRCFSTSERATGKIAYTGPPQDGRLLEVQKLRVAVPSSAWGQAKWLGAEKGVSFALSRGDTLLLQGESGVGKSSLLRSIAGIWECGSGEISRVEDVMFLPQSAYLPTGEANAATTLRAQLMYPAKICVAGPSDAAREASDNALLLTALGDVNLPHLAALLDEAKDWSTMLSGGEKQRLVFARLLVQLRLHSSAAPPVVLLDEATSACSEQVEEQLYQVLMRCIESMDGAIVTVGHRSSLRTFHKGLMVME